MKQLLCDICGGKLIMSDDRQSSQCENCGVEYSLNAMKDMIASFETVELRVKGVSTAQSLVDYAYSFIDINIVEAESQFKEALKIDPKCTIAWKGLFDCQARKLERFHDSPYPYKYIDITIDNKMIKLQTHIRDHCGKAIIFFHGFLEYDVSVTVNDKYGFMDCDLNSINVYYNTHKHGNEWEGIVFEGNKAHIYINNALKYATPDKKSEYSQIEYDFFNQDLDLVKKAVLFCKENVLQIDRVLEEVGSATVEKTVNAANEEESCKQEKLKQSLDWKERGLCTECGGKFKWSKWRSDFYEGHIREKECSVCGNISSTSDEERKQWEDQVLCSYCGGRLSLFGKKDYEGHWYTCKSCGRRNNLGD